MPVVGRNLLYFCLFDFCATDPRPDNARIVVDVVTLRMSAEYFGFTLSVSPHKCFILGHETPTLQNLSSVRRCWMTRHAIPGFENVPRHKAYAMAWLFCKPAVWMRVSLCFSNTRLSSTFAKVRKATISFVMSVRLHGRTRLPLDGFW